MSKISSYFKTHLPSLTFWLGKKKCILSTLFYRRCPIKWTLKEYKKRFGVKLNLDDPKSFFEKMNYIKHFYYNDKETILSDKYNVKKILTENGDGGVVTKVLYHTDNIRDLKKWFMKNKDTFKSFVFKTSHSCGDIFIYNNGKITRKYGIKIKNINSVFRMLKTALKYNHYYTCFESNYRYIKPLVFVEEYIEMNNSVEFEFMTNYGQIKFINVVNNRQSKQKSELLYDPLWKPIGNNIKPISAPSKVEYMKKFITKYASDFPFCRVDFIENGDKLYFCEFTFVKSGGIGSFGSAELDKAMGEYLDISKLLNEEK